MTVQDLINLDNFEAINISDGDLEITEVYCCDLLSIAMGNAPADSAWCTVMSNLNTLAVASLADTACVILCCGTRPDDTMKKKAEIQGINLICTEKAIFDTALEVYNQING